MKLKIALFAMLLSFGFLAGCQDESPPTVPQGSQPSDPQAGSGSAPTDETDLVNTNKAAGGSGAGTGGGVSTGVGEHLNRDAEHRPNEENTKDGK